MHRKPAVLERDCVPAIFHAFLDGAAVYDSSCSSVAQVWFLDKGPGFFLKKAPKDSLQKEAELTRFFRSKGLAAEVLAYESLDSDWLLTRRVPGEDCTWQPYLENPKRLCDTIAELLRTLHDSPVAGCPVPSRTAEYLATARQNYLAGSCDLSYSPDFQTAEDAWKFVEDTDKYLRSDTLLHGDYCLPNIMLDNWAFSGFIDLDHAGVGDRHVDIYWGIWSLQFNLKTDRYRDRFLDVYGREHVSEDLLETVAAIEVFG